MTTTMTMTIMTTTITTTKTNDCDAGVAQLVEPLICNQQVVGSSPTAGSVCKFNLRVNSW